MKNLNKTIKEIEEKHCRCGKDYVSINRIDPTCQVHDLLDDIEKVAKEAIDAVRVESIKYREADEEKISRFLVGTLGQYGTQWGNFTELQKATFEKDVEQLSRGLMQIIEKRAIKEAQKKEEDYFENKTKIKT